MPGESALSPSKLNRRWRTIQRVVCCKYQQLVPLLLKQSRSNCLQRAVPNLCPRVRNRCMLFACECTSLLQHVAYPMRRSRPVDLATILKDFTSQQQVEDVECST